MASELVADSLSRNLSSLSSTYWWHRGRVYWAKQLIAQWRQQANLSGPLSYADLGCGTGLFAAQIIKDFPVAESFLVDENPVLDPRVRSMDVKTVKADLGIIIPLPHPVDLVTCMDVVEHLADDTTFLRSVSQAMRPDGLFILSVPAHPVLFSQWDVSLGHYRRYATTDLLRKLESAGFSIRFACHMWAPFWPLGFLRKLQGGKVSTEFPTTPKLLNEALYLLSKIEFAIASLIRIPFGTSLIVAAVPSEAEKKKRVSGRNSN